MSMKVNKRSLWDSVWEIATELEDMDLLEMGMNECDIATFFEKGLLAFKRDDLVFIMNDYEVLSIYTENEFVSLLANRELLVSFKAQPINEFMYHRIQAMVG